jgi:hypothetical protein
LQALATNTVLYTVAPATKTFSAVSGMLSFRERAVVQVTGIGTSVYSAGNLVFAIMDSTTLLARCASFSSADGATFSGVVDMNTTELERYFTNAAPQLIREPTFLLYDTASGSTLANTRSKVQNQAYRDGMAAPSLLGMSYMDVAPTAGNWRVWCGNLELYDQVSGGWRTVYVYDGGLSVGTNQASSTTPSNQVTPTLVSVMRPVSSEALAEGELLQWEVARNCFVPNSPTNLRAVATNLSWGNVSGTLSNQVDLWVYLGSYTNFRAGQGATNTFMTNQLALLQGSNAAQDVAFNTFTNAWRGTNTYLTNQLAVIQGSNAAGDAAFNTFTNAWRGTNTYLTNQLAVIQGSNAAGDAAFNTFTNAWRGTNTYLTNQLAVIQGSNAAIRTDFIAYTNATGTGGVSVAGWTAFTNAAAQTNICMTNTVRGLQGSNTAIRTDFSSHSSGQGTTNAWLTNQVRILSWSNVWLEAQVGLVQGSNVSQDTAFNTFTNAWRGTNTYLTNQLAILQGSNLTQDTAFNGFTNLWRGTNTYLTNQLAVIQGSNAAIRTDFGSHASGQGTTNAWLTNQVRILSWSNVWLEAQVGLVQGSNTSQDTAFNTFTNAWRGTNTYLTNQLAILQGSNLTQDSAIDGFTNLWRGTNTYLTNQLAVIQGSNAAIRTDFIAYTNANGTGGVSVAVWTAFTNAAAQTNIYMTNAFRWLQGSNTAIQTDFSSHSSGQGTTNAWLTNQVRILAWSNVWLEGQVGLVQGSNSSQDTAFNTFTNAWRGTNTYLTNQLAILQGSNAAQDTAFNTSTNAQQQTNSSIRTDYIALTNNLAYCDAELWVTNDYREHPGTAGYQVITNLVIGAYTNCTMTPSSIVVAVAGWYDIGWTASFTPDAMGASDLFAHVFTNNVNSYKIGWARTVTSAAFESSAGGGRCYLPAGTKLDLRLDVSVDTAVTWDYMVFKVWRMRP